MTTEPQPKPDRNWPNDEFGRSESRTWLWLVLAPLIVVALLLLFQFAPTKTGTAQVVAYCAQDQVYAEPIFRDFERHTGIQVRSVFDSEAVKTVGLANRLIAERSRPQCDVFFGNEEMRTRQLAAANVFRETNAWAAFGYRSRRVVINTNLLPLANAPRSLLDLTNDAWRGKLALAYPQFGTTATHFHTLRQLWGEPAWVAWCQALARNQPLLVDGNSIVVKLVGRGEAWIGLTDSDDIAAGQREGLPVAALPTNAETLLIPNTVAVIRAAPHAAAADRLFHFLQSPGVVEKLVAVRALEGALVSGVPTPTLQVDWDRLLRDLDTTSAALNAVFLR